LGVLSYVIGKKLQGNETIQAGVFGFVDHAHAATAKLFDNAVVRDGVFDQ
jgi:hypothetical protein